MLSKTAKTLASFGRKAAAAQLKKMPWTKRRIDGAKRRILKPFVPLRERLEENSRQAARKELISDFNNKAAGSGRPKLQSRTKKALPAKTTKKTNAKIVPVTNHRQGGPSMSQTSKPQFAAAAQKQKKTVQPQFKAAAQNPKKSAPPPRLTMAGGPKPPGSVANAVNRQVRQSQNQSNAVKNAKAPSLNQQQTRQQQFNDKAQKQSLAQRNDAKQRAQSATQKFNQASAQKTQGMQKGGMKR